MHCLPVELFVTSEEEAEAICWEHCQSDAWDKTGCFHDGCPLAQIEIKRCHEMTKQCNELTEQILLAQRNMAVMRHNNCVVAAAVMSACT